MGVGATVRVALSVAIVRSVVLSDAPPSRSPWFLRMDLDVTRSVVAGIVMALNARNENHVVVVPEDVLAKAVNYGALLGPALIWPVWSYCCRESPVGQRDSELDLVVAIPAAESPNWCLPPCATAARSSSEAPPCWPPPSASGCPRQSSPRPMTSSHDWTWR
jgi:hypothetical protein